MKKVCAILLIFAAICTISGCMDKEPYDADWIIGKTAAEIQERYGEFHKYGLEKPADGVYRNRVVTYYIRKGARMITGERLPDIKFHIHFNEDGIADEAYRREEYMG